MGWAGTGKTFITFYNALLDVLDVKSPYEKIYIVRSLVATREIGFLLVTTKISHLFIRFLIRTWSNTCSRCQMTTLSRCCTLISKHKERLVSGPPPSSEEQLSIKAIIIVDEFQNLNFHELDSIITRVGVDSKILFCGDATQSDLTKQNERNGIADFMKILRNMLPLMSLSLKQKISVVLVLSKSTLLLNLNWVFNVYS